MRRAFACLAAVVLTACSGSGGDATPETASSPSTSSTPTTTTVEPAPDAASAFDQLVLMRADDRFEHLDVALAELSTWIGPIPGAPSLQDDDSLYPSLTHVVTEIELDRDQLTAEQDAAVTAGLEELFPPEEMTSEFRLFDGPGDDAEGFALRAATPLDDASPEVTAAVRAAATAVRSFLGGPELNISVQTFPVGGFSGAGALNVALRPDDPRRDDFDEPTDCIIRLAVGGAVADLAGIVAHEITHCWQFTRLGLDVSLFDATGEWVIEGQAAYAGRVIGGRTRFDDSWWHHYLDASVDGNGQWKLYPSVYDAIGFWARVAQGSDVVAAMGRALDAAPADAAMLAAATRDLSPWFGWIGAGTAQRSDWGAGWTASGAGDPGTPRAAIRSEVIERNDVALSAVAGAQANHEIEVTPIGTADGSVMTMRGRGAGVVRVNDSDVELRSSYSEQWCIGSCLCPDGTPAYPSDRTLEGAVTVFASIAGTPSESTRLNVLVERFDPDDTDRCADEAPPALSAEADGDLGGLVGTWRADPESVGRSLESASAAGDGVAALDVAGVGGDVLLTFGADGTGTLSYDDVVIVLNEELIGDLTLSGGGTFAWSPSGTSVIIDGLEYSVSVGSSALGGSILTLTSDDVPAEGTTRLSGAVAEDQLVFTSADGSEGDVFFPMLWARVD